MPKQPTGQRAVMNFDQRTAALDLLKQHITVDPLTGIATYNEGWSDELIAEAVGRPGAAGGVRQQRLKKFGTMIAKRGAGKKKETDALLDMIAELRRDINQIAQAVVRLAIEAEVDISTLNLPKAEK